jgi:hypothetical protein
LSETAFAGLTLRVSHSAGRYYIDDVDPPAVEELHVISTAVHRLYGEKKG